MRMLTVTDREAGQRLDKLLAKYLRLAGKGFLQFIHGFSYLLLK